ncbi:helix-turn-helix transcriptional regulator [Fretibacterium sp. OH1220_COT-178]|uniref:helix-turn-helix transcriptional regulator n=1 Tax=Fretibacterium sp. OH1220_COT-178 TaxID=2491047 RepID=UPI0013152ECE|nr:WYL domain-containing protein [Fretibacterium sp. OH1220_COT-178]
MRCAGGSIGGRSALPLCILQVQKDYSDEEHPLTSGAIIQKLEADYGLSAARNAVGRNISLLCELGWDISTYEENGRGAYLRTREFSDVELRVLIDSVLSSKYIPQEEAGILIQKLADLVNRHFRGRLRHVHSLPLWPHHRNRAFFENLERIEAAIENRKQLRFVLNSIGVNGELSPRGDRPYVVHPFAMICTNGQYYLVGCYGGYDNLTHYRIDRMTDVTVLDDGARPIGSLPGYRDGKSFDAALYAQEHHFMFGGKPVTVVLRMSRSCAGDVLDAFGSRAAMRVLDDDRMEVRVTAALEGMRFFALQFGNHCEVVSPRKLREQVVDDIKKMAERYGL